MTTVQKVAIILNSPSDWEVWIDMIRNRARIANVWKFIDPSVKEEDLPMLARPTLPLPRDIDPTKTLISELTPEERECRSHRDLSIKRFVRRTRNLAETISRELS